MALASSLLLRSGDVGAGWSSRLSSGTSATCDAVIQPHEADLTENGVAKSPLFVHGNSQAINQSVSVLATDQQAVTAWQRMTGKSLLLCTEQQMENTSSMSAPVSVTDWQPLPVPKLAHAVGYRVIADAKTSAKSTTKVFFDVFVLASGRATTRVALTALKMPYSRVFEQRLLDAIGTRLTASAKTP